VFVLGIVMTGIASNPSVRGTKISSSAFVDVRELLGVAIEASRAGGQEVWEVARTGVLQASTKGPNKEIVTLADDKSNAAIMGMLNAQFKGVAIRSEEGSSSPPSAAQGRASKEATKLLSKVLPQLPAQAGRVTVWVDPLDATLEFSTRLLHYVSVMVCIAVDGVPVAGVIHFPFTDKTVWAVQPDWSGAGSTSNIVAPKQAPPPPADPRASTADGEQIRFVVSRSHAGDAVRDSALLGASNVAQAGGAGFKAVDVLQGQADAYYHSTNIKKWDICAAEAIFRAAGGRLTTRQGKAIDYSADAPELLEADAATGAGGIAASVYYHNTLLHRLANLSSSSMGKV
jgi:inositol monophosphatase 3